MPNLGLPIPPLDKMVQKDHIILFDAEKNPHKEETGSKTTSLRFFLSRAEKKILMDAVAEDIAKNTSDFEAFCPVCLEDYITPGEEAILGPEKASQLNEKPLKLYCGHVLGHNCFKQMMNMTGGDVRKCPICRRHIDPSHKNPPLLHNKIPFIDRNGEPNFSGGLCCAIRLFICTNPTEPETLQALNEWMHSQLLEDYLLEVQTEEKKLYIVVMRWAVSVLYGETKEMLAGKGHVAVDTR